MTNQPDPLDNLPAGDGTPRDRLPPAPEQVEFDFPLASERTREDLVITEHELVVEEDEFLEDVYVESVVEHTGEERYDYVEVAVRVYDNEGRQLDRYMTNTTDLDGGVEWVTPIEE